MKRTVFKEPPLCAQTCDQLSDHMFGQTFGHGKKTVGQTFGHTEKCWVRHLVAPKKHLVGHVIAASKDVVRHVVAARKDVVRHVVTARKPVFMLLLTCVPKNNRSLSEASAPSKKSPMQLCEIILLISDARLFSDLGRRQQLVARFHDVDCRF